MAWTLGIKGGGLMRGASNISKMLGSIKWKKNGAGIDQETVGRTAFVGKMRHLTVNMLPLPIR